MSATIEDIERRMLEDIGASQYESFIHTFNLYMGLEPATKSTLRLKSMGLLYYLAIGNHEEYYMLLQTIRADELSAEEVRFIMAVDENVIKQDVGAIEQMARVSPDVTGLLNMLVDTMKNQAAGDAVAEGPQATETAGATEDHLKNIRDCMHIAKNIGYD